jgi:hypothetical protein
MKYFTIDELTRSATARRLGIDNSPTEFVRGNLEELVKYVLDPLRAAWGAPIIVTSGYRCPRLNSAVGGAKQRQHVSGMAADIRTVSDTREDNMALLRCLLRLNLPFDKLISEYVDSQGRPDWIHVSYSPMRRGIKLTCKNGRYTNGIKVK